MVFSFEAEGEVRLYPGNYSIYLEHKKEEEEKEGGKTKEQKVSNSQPFVPEIKKPKSESKKPSKASFKEKREYEDLELKIPQLEAEKIQVEKKLYHNPPSGHTEVQKLSDRLVELTKLIEKSTERWLELSERI